jgi:hypothetical protein
LLRARNRTVVRMACPFSAAGWPACSDGEL